jgi:hypothetical protein
MRLIRSFLAWRIETATTRDVFRVSFLFHLICWLTILLLSLPFVPNGQEFLALLGLALSGPAFAALWTLPYWSLVFLNRMLGRGTFAVPREQHRWTAWGAWIGITALLLALYAEVFWHFSGLSRAESNGGPVLGMLFYALFLMIVSPIPAAVGAVVGRVLGVVIGRGTRAS